MPELTVGGSSWPPKPVTVKHHQLLFLPARPHKSKAGPSMTLASDHHAQSSTDNPLWFYELFFWLYWVFIAPHKLSLVAVSGGYSSLWCAGVVWISHWGSTSHSLVAEYGLWTMWDSVVVHTELVALPYAESSWTRDWTHVPCRQIPIHCTTREVHPSGFKRKLLTPI